MSQAETNRQVIEEFYDLAFVQKRPREAAARHIGETYTQHNSFVPDGVDAFIEHFEHSQAHKSPHYRQRPLRFVVDEDHVAVHVMINRTEDDPGIVLVDIFRLQDGKIVEHWDVGMPIPDPATVPHDNGVI